MDTIRLCLILSASHSADHHMGTWYIEEGGMSVSVCLCVSKCCFVGVKMCGSKGDITAQEEASLKGALFRVWTLPLCLGVCSVWVSGGGCKPLCQMGHTASWMRWLVWLEVVYCLLLKRWTPHHALQVPHTPRSQTHTHRIFKAAVYALLSSVRLTHGHMIYGLMTPHQYLSLCSKVPAHISECHRVSEVGWSVDLLPVGRSYKCSHSGIDFQTNCTRCFAHSYHPMLRPIPLPVSPPGIELSPLFSASQWGQWLSTMAWTAVESGGC